MTTSQTGSQQERREFFRLNFKTPVNFITADSLTNQQKAKQGLSSNVSQSGILFQTQNEPPKVSTLVWMDLDLRTLQICREIEKKALVHNNRILGRVVRVEESAATDDSYDVGVCFLTEEQRSDRNVQKLLNDLQKS